MKQRRSKEQFVMFDWFVLKLISGLFFIQAISNFYARHWIVGLAMIGVLFLLGLIGQALYSDKTFNELASGKFAVPNFDDAFRSEFSHADARKIARSSYGVGFAVGFGIMVLLVNNGMKWYWGMLLWLVIFWLSPVFITIYLGLVMLIATLFKKRKITDSSG